MTYQITYNYTDECGNETRDIPETYEGSWEGLQGIVNKMREGGCYDIHADAVDDYVEIVTEYHAEDGETYCIIKDGKGYGAINKTDIVDGIVVTAYTGIDACAADTPEEVLKILRGRIKVTAWKAEGLSFEEIARRTKDFYNSEE